MIKYYLGNNCIYKKTDEAIFCYDTIDGWYQTVPYHGITHEITEEDAFAWVMEHPVTEINEDIYDKIAAGMAKNIREEIDKRFIETVYEVLSKQ